MEITINKATPVVLPPPTITLELSLREFELLTALIGSHSPNSFVQAVNDAGLVKAGIIQRVNNVEINECWPYYQLHDKLVKAKSR